MRTTLDIDDDLLAAAKEIARQQGITAGQAVSRSLRASLTGIGPAPRPARKSCAPGAGFDPFPARAGVVATYDRVNELRDAEAI